jgi:hypothetical protein
MLACLSLWSLCFLALVRYNFVEILPNHTVKFSIPLFISVTLWRVSHLEYRWADQGVREVGAGGDGDQVAGGSLLPVDSF